MIVQDETEKMLKKKKMAPVKNEAEYIVSSIFIVSKKPSRFRPVINLKKLNSCVEYNRFKMEGLLPLRELLKEANYICKLDLKDAYFSWLLHKDSQSM